MKKKRILQGNIIGLGLVLVLILTVGHVEASFRTVAQIIEVVLIEDGLTPVIQGDGLWNPSEREKAPIGLTPKEMRSSRSFDAVSSFLPSGSDFIILDPRITSLRVRDPGQDIKGFIKGWTSLTFNPNPSYLPPRLTLDGKFVPRAGDLYWNEVMNLMSDDKSTLWANVTWKSGNVNQSSLIKPGLDDLFPYWRSDIFTYLYIIDVIYYFDENVNDTLVMGTIYMYQLIFKESTMRNEFWLYSPVFTREWWITVYLILNSILLGSLLVIILRYKKSIKQLQANS